MLCFSFRNTIEKISPRSEQLFSMTDWKFCFVDFAAVKTEWFYIGARNRLHGFRSSVAERYSGFSCVIRAAQRDAIVPNKIPRWRFARSGEFGESAGVLKDRFQVWFKRKAGFFRLFLFLPAHRLIHYTIKRRKVRLHNYCFGSSFPFRSTIFIYELDFSRF